MIGDDFPETLPEFHERFGDEDACIEQLRQVKWPDGFRCPSCGHQRSYTIADRQLDECASCGHQASVTAGTMFHRTQKPLTVWFRVIFEFVSRKDGCNAMDIARLFNLSYPTAWTWLQKIRDTMARPGRKRLAGTVEVDETHVGGSEEGVFGRDRGEKKILVAGAVEVVEDHCGRVRLAPVESGSAENLRCRTLIAARLPITGCTAA